MAFLRIIFLLAFGLWLAFWLSLRIARWWHGRHIMAILRRMDQRYEAFLHERLPVLILEEEKPDPATLEAEAGQMLEPELRNLSDYLESGNPLWFIGRSQHFGALQNYCHAYSHRPPEETLSPDALHHELHNRLHEILQADLQARTRRIT